MINQRRRDVPNDMRPVGIIRKNSRKFFSMTAGMNGGQRVVSIRLVEQMPNGTTRALPVWLTIREDQAEEFIDLFNAALTLLRSQPSPAGGDHAAE
jgi:hypothetical protein